jgi:hypothetical protein
MKAFARKGNADLCVRDTVRSDTSKEVLRPIDFN